MLLLSFVILLSTCVVNAKYESTKSDRATWNFKAMRMRDKVFNHSRSNSFVNLYNMYIHSPNFNFIIARIYEKRITFIYELNICANKNNFNLILQHTLNDWTCV